MSVIWEELIVKRLQRWMRLQQWTLHMLPSKWAYSRERIADFREYRLPIIKEDEISKYTFWKLSWGQVVLVQCSLILIINVFRYVRHRLLKFSSYHTQFLRIQLLFFLLTPSIILINLAQISVSNSVKWVDALSEFRNSLLKLLVFVLPLREKLRHAMLLWTQIGS